MFKKYTVKYGPPSNILSVERKAGSENNCPDK
jgi:hypothetical protein